MTKEQKNILQDILEMGEIEAHHQFSEDPLVDLWNTGESRGLYAAVPKRGMLGSDTPIYGEMDTPLFAWPREEDANRFAEILKEEIEGEVKVKVVVINHHSRIVNGDTFILKPARVSVNANRIVFLEEREWKPVGPKKDVTRLPATKIGGGK